jgi:nucleotide-binding universal stress UspA family protein
VRGEGTTVALSIREIVGWQDRELSTIVVGTDFSSEAEVAIVHAVGVARHVGARLVLLHAGSMVDPTFGDDLLPRTHAALYRAYLEQSARRLRGVRNRLADRGVEVSELVVEGFADSAICRSAHRLGAGLVIVGSHGRTGLRRLLLGSVAERVVRLCRCSVLVARPPTRIGGYRRLLVPVDFSDLSARAIAMALELAAADAEVRVVHCWLRRPIESFDAAARGEREEGGAATALEVERRGADLLGRFGDDPRLSFAALQAPPTEGILALAGDQSSDLIVVGSRRHRGLRRLLLGSVAEATVRHARCSVAVIHRRAEP